MSRFKIGDIVVHPYGDINSLIFGCIYGIENETFFICWYVSSWSGTFGKFMVKYDHTNEVFLLYTDSMREDD